MAKALGEPRGVGSVDQGIPAYPKPTPRPQARFHHGGRRLSAAHAPQAAADRFMPRGALRKVQLGRRAAAALVDMFPDFVVIERLGDGVAQIPIVRMRELLTKVLCRHAGLCDKARRALRRWQAYAAAVPGAGVDAWGTGVAPATLADFLCEVRANAVRNNRSGAAAARVTRDGLVFLNTSVGFAFPVSSVVVRAVAPRPAASAPKKKAGVSVFMLVHFEELAHSHPNRFVRDVARSFVVSILLSCRYDDLQCGRIGGLDVSMFPPVLTFEFLLNKTGSVEDIEPGAVLQQFPLVMTGLRDPFAWAPEWHAMRAVTRAFLLDFSFERGGAAERMLRVREWSLDSLGQHMPMPGAAGRKCLRQLLSMEPLAATPEEIKEWRATGHGGRHFLVTAARAFEARLGALDELGRWAGPRRQAPSLAASTGGGAMAARYSEEVGDAIFASARCCLVAALRVLCASVDWSRDLTRGPDGGSLLTLVRSERGAAARRTARPLRAP
mmetsp:Transcript_28553/g.71875  ORF Transcript_28553/g.71875 Transcript_28553/m.71875 type:complete len:497 (+) Transcript_28553:586-2076(+)